MITDQDLFVKLAKGRQRTLARIEALPEAERGQSAGLIPLLRAAKPIERVQPDLPVYTPRMGNPQMSEEEIRAKIKELQREASEDSQRTIGKLFQGEKVHLKFPKFIPRESWIAGHNIWRAWKHRASRRRRDIELLKFKLEKIGRGGNPLTFRTSRGEMTEAEMMEVARQAAERREIPPDYRQASTAARWLDSAGTIRLEGAKLMREGNPKKKKLSDMTLEELRHAEAVEWLRWEDQPRRGSTRSYGLQRGHHFALMKRFKELIEQKRIEEYQRPQNPPMLVLGNPGNRRKNAPMLILGNPKSGPADSAAAQELELFIANDADLYRQQFWPIVKNLMHRNQRGDFDFEKSVKLWGYFVDNGAKKYIKEHGTPGQKIDSMFNKNTRLIVARSLANSFVTEAEYGNYDQAGLTWGRGKNPQIHSMDDASWKKATKAHKIQWLQNVIAYRKATTRPGVPDSMSFYWLKKYEKRLASLQRGSNPELDEFCPQCGGDPTLIGKLGNLDWFRCRQCGWEWSAPAENQNAGEALVKEKVPAAACPRCGGWTSFGGMSQHSASKRRVMGRRGCVCHGQGRVKRGKNPSELPAHIANDPAFKKELAAFHKRHGNIPARIIPVQVPDGFPKYMSEYGKAPEAKYDAPKGSKKGKRFHIFGKKGKGRPSLVSSVEKGPKFLAYVGGKFKAKTDWLYD